MNSGIRALTLRTKLLVAEYGRKRVIAALAQIEEVEFEAIEQEIDAAKKRRSNTPRRPKTLFQLMQEAKIDSQTSSLIEQIAGAYQNKRYLSELWRVRRFLEAQGVDARKLPSRSAALPQLIKALGNLSEKELTQILAGINESEKGDLRIIADQILGSPKDGSRTVKEAARGGVELEPPVGTE